MKRILATIFGVLLVAGAASAQTTNGTLTVQANVQGSINLTFENVGGFTLASGASSATATADLGNISQYGTLSAAGVARVAAIDGTAQFAVQAPIGVQVVKANSASANYTLAATINAAGADTNKYYLGGQLLSAAPATVTAAGAYGAAQSHNLQIDVMPASSGALNRTVSVSATAN